MKRIKLSIKLKQERGSLKKNKLCAEFIHKLLKKYKKVIVAEQMKEYGQKHGVKSLKKLKEWETTNYIP